MTESCKGNNIVLIIDEAQNLGVQQLEQIRLLSNLETEKDKLLQIVLVGQPELQEKLLLPELRQLRQRISVHFNLNPLKQADISDYIHHRILKAAIRDGIHAHPVFTDDAVERIYHFTKGSPRTINLCVIVPCWQALQPANAQSTQLSFNIVPGGNVL